LGRLGRGLRRRLSGTAPCCESLRCFEEEMVSHCSERKARVPEAVELGKIVGSVGRCGAFDAGFLPVCSCSAERWKRVYGAFLEGKTLPPVELYKLGGALPWGGGRGRRRHRVRLSHETAAPRGFARSRAP
jgi:hypothetical protein